jgi:hypothetical protein
MPRWWGGWAGKVKGGQDEAIVGASVMEADAGNAIPGGFVNLLGR